MCKKELSTSDGPVDHLRMYRAAKSQTYQAFDSTTSPADRDTCFAWNCG